MKKKKRKKKDNDKFTLILNVRDKSVFEKEICMITSRRRCFLWRKFAGAQIARTTNVFRTSFNNNSFSSNLFVLNEVMGVDKYIAELIQFYSYICLDTPFCRFSGR